MSLVFDRLNKYKTILELYEKDKLDLEEQIEKTRAKIRDLEGCIDLLD